MAWRPKPKSSRRSQRTPGHARLELKGQIGVVVVGWDWGTGEWAKSSTLLSCGVAFGQGCGSALTFDRQSRPHRGARSPRWTHSPWFGFSPATMPLMPLLRPALWSVSRQSPNRSFILHTSGSGKRQRSPRGGQMVRLRTISNHAIQKVGQPTFNVAPRALITREFASPVQWRAALRLGQLSAPVNSFDYAQAYGRLRTSKLSWSRPSPIRR